MVIEEGGEECGKGGEVAGEREEVGEGVVWKG